MWMQVYVDHFGVSIKNINLFGAKIPFKLKSSFRGKAVIFIKKYATAKEAEVLFLEDTWNPNKENVNWKQEPEFDGFSIVNAETEWFEFSDTKFPWARDVTHVIGEKAKVAIAGNPQYTNGKKKIVISTFDKYNNESVIMENSFIDTKGRCSANTAVYGLINTFNR